MTIFRARHIDLPDYWEHLREFDWDFESSDDHAVWQAGRQRLEELRSQATLSDEHAALFVQFQRHHSSRNRLLENLPALPERPTP